MARDIHARFGNRIRQLRRERGWTQTQMADFVSIDRSYLADMERGAANVTLAMLQKLAKGLDISLRELFDGL